MILFTFVHRILGFPFTRYKYKGGSDLFWSGYGADLTTWQIGSSCSRAEWASSVLEDLTLNDRISGIRAAEGLGLFRLVATTVGSQASLGTLVA